MKLHLPFKVALVFILLTLSFSAIGISFYSVLNPNVFKKPGEVGAASEGAALTVTVDAAAVKNDNFANLLGSFIAEYDSPSTRVDFTNPNLIATTKKILPQDPEHPPVMRTESGLSPMFTGDWIIRDEDVKAIIRFCEEVNCDPMFASIGGSDWSITDDEIRARVRLVKSECARVFGDERHCLHWDIGNEPPSSPQSCVELADFTHRAGLIIRELIPNSVIHGLELWSYSAKVSGTDETIGECIVRKLNEKTPKLKIDVLQTHWYPYLGDEDVKNRVFTDGFKLLTWGGANNPRSSKTMTYPHEIAREMYKYARKYEVSREAVIGIGELNPVALIGDYTGLYLSDAVRGCCWLKTNYQPDLNLYGHSPTCNCNPCQGGLEQEEMPMPPCCQKKCRIPDSFPTKRLNLTWGAAFWYLDELGIMAEAGIKYNQKLGLNGSNGRFTLISNTGQRTASSYAYEFYANYFGNKVVASSSNDPAVLNSHASLDRQGNLRLLLINKRDATAPIRIEISVSNYEALNSGEAYVFKLPSKKYFNNEMDASTPPDLIQTVTGVNVGKSFSYDVDGFSAVILKIPTSQPPAELNLKTGWNKIAWKESYGYFRPSTVPAGCVVSGKYGGWFGNFLKDWGLNIFWPAHSGDLYVRCLNDATWQI